MKLPVSKIIALPLTIISVVLASLFINQKKPSNTVATLKLSQSEITTPPEIKPENTQKQPVNPLPETVTVLGVEDTQKEETAVSFDPQTLYRLINSYRTDSNLSKLAVNKLLEDSASRKLRDMVQKNYFRHADTSNNESWYLFNAAGYNYTSAGENLSSGYNTPWQAFTAWQRSPQHNEQLLKPEYLDMGLAVDCTVYEEKGEPACILVLHLGTR